jgi:hypothetical protein
MAIGNLQIGQAAQITGSQNVKSGQGAILGVIVSGSTSGTLALYDSATTTTTSKLVDTIALTGGGVLPISLGFSAGLYAVIGGTASITIVYV